MLPHATPTPDALTLLMADHYHLHNLFAHFEYALSSARRSSLRDQICLELGVHMQIEEEILYPAIDLPAEHPLLLAEAAMEQADIRELIERMRDADVDQPATLTQMRELSRRMTSHVQQAHDDLFPRVRGSALDIAALGVRLADRQRELLS